ncbi:MAG: CYTH domain-containing protein [Patescibacteria group bacterium]
MYEVELKVELTAEDKENLIAEFKARGFVAKGMTPQNDYYIEAKKSQYKGYDLKRYREEAGKYIYTEKIWEIVDDQPARRENEHEVTEPEFKSVIAQYPDAIKIIKDREWFAGEYQSTPISLTIDSVKFDHSPSMRFFTEAEIDVEDRTEVSKAKEIIELFLKDVLKKTEIVESPGMFMMAFEKR